ncbi:uncharacterized protein TNCV_2899531 [Trichonephila clavipes]|nr:uncharacterized protein TNCV_2899531 [Trichonephila clavipes]
MAFPTRTKKQQVRKKKNIKSSITKLQNKTEEEIEKLNNVGLLARKNRFLEFRTEIKDILDSIISICEEKDEETYCTEKDDILDTLEEILVAIDTQLMPSAVNSDFEVKNQGSSHSLVSARSAEVKLPTLSLPIFSGVTEEWLAFSDLFEAAVSNNNDLTGAQKLQYLKGSLKSDALKIINSLSITNDNFEIAWKLLKDRYFNKREIMSSLIKKFINITPLSGESCTQILNLIDSTKEFVRMLESLEYMVDPTTDTLLMHMILFKLDPNSRTWFERTYSTDVIPRLDELLQFLATQARSITSSTTKRNVQGSVKTCKSKFRCKKCKKPHHSLLHFENVSAKGRQGAVNVLNSRELSINAPVFSPVPISGTSEPSENSRVVDVTSCISDVNPDVQILLCTALIQGQTLSLGKDKPFAIRSELGWIIGGKANSSGQNSFHVNHIQLVSDQLINKFWELDSVPCAKPLTSLEEACEDHFVKTHSRDENGRYTVKLPFHTPPTRLGNSKQNAIRRLISVERHLISNPDKYKLYRNFIKEYLDLKHMELVPDSEINNIKSLYLPHHGVVRDTSCTTKLRVVFDASSKTSSGLSLNDLLMVGPRVQPELFPILIQFRIFSVAICADVEKMFRQIKVHEEDVDWQRILWRDSPTEPIREYRLTTVTYGTSSAPFLSTRTLRQLAVDEQENYPAASRATLSHFYVDDLLSGKELKAVDSKHTIKDDQPVKILGIAWLPDVDRFTFTITVNETDVWTKRKLWSHHLSWDEREELPDSLERQWRTFQEQLPLLTNIKIPCCILIPQAIDVQVHGFCDSSEKAYCAVIYIRSKDATQTVVSRLLTSKTRVSPVKPQSLPRLELCSALLLANLLQATLPTLTVSISETFAWSDSKITLAWLKSDPRRWQPFVANRVAQIQELTPKVHWNFVSGLENPADCGTRGIPPTKLEKCNLWFNGPDWLRSSTFPIGEFEDNPQLQEHMSAEAKRTSKLIMLNVVDATFKAEFFQKFSSWNKLKRVVAYCLRFVKNCSLSACKRRKSF